ncbi:MAG: hypothetical protein JRJ87_09920 [Deltaproteobacteria bacterium]|nr:hypothetical protein [Deltaproteobacteria bacterium]
MKNRNRPAWSSVAALIVCLSGCGFVDAPGDPGNALWTLNCKIEQVQPGLDTGDLRVALVWARNLGPTNGVATINQDLPIKPEFPAKFSLDLFNLPPEDALIEGQGDLVGLEIAVGILMVYDDRNHNQELDILPAGAQRPVDYLLGPAEQYRLVFAQGKPTGQSIDGLAIEAGMNLLLLSGQFGTEKIPFDATLALSLVDSMASQHMMCIIPPGYTASSEDLGSVDHTAIPSDATINCRADGYQLDFTYTVWHQAGVCGDITEIRYSGSSSIEQGQAPPDGWPCEVN